MQRSYALEITLSGDALKYIRRKVASRQFASPSAVIEEAVSLLQAQDGDFEDWLREEGKPMAAYFKPDAVGATPATAVERYLEEQRRRRAKTR